MDSGFVAGIMCISSNNTVRGHLFIYLTLDAGTLWLDLKIDRKKRVFFHLAMMKALIIVKRK